MKPTEAQQALLLELAAEITRESFHQGFRDRVADGGSPELFAAVDAVLAAEDAWLGLELAVDRDLVPFGLDPLALPAMERLLSTPMASEGARLLSLVTDSNGKRRALFAMLLVTRAPPSLFPELSATLEANAEDLELEPLLGLQLPPDRRALLAPIESAQARRESTARVRASLTTAATRWRDAWGLPVGPFRIGVRCQDVSRNNKKASHLREQTSHLEIDMGHTPVQGPEKDLAWAIRLRAGRGEPRHGFTPSRWSGVLEATMLQLDEVTGSFREDSGSPVRKGRTVELKGTIDAIPKLVGEIEVLTERSFHVAEALIVASVGEALDRDLAERVRAWLITR